MTRLKWTSLTVLVVFLLVAACAPAAPPPTPDQGEEKSTTVAPRRPTATPGSTASPTMVPSAATATPTSSRSPSGGLPRPQLDWTTQHVERTYTPFGTCSGQRIGVYITNQGGSGNVTVTAHKEYADKTYSEMFWMDSGETVMVQLKVSCFGFEIVKWTARPAQPGDASDGVIIVERR